MVTLAVVSYPTLDETDRRWIEAIRARHDPRADRIAAHFTLVFPTDAAPPDVAEEMAAVSRSAAPIAFVIRRAVAARDAASGIGHVFLVPDEGAEAIADLHRRLYAGVLRPHLRADLPFEPHVTVAAEPDVGRCEAIARQVTQACRPIIGTIAHLDLVNVAGSVSSIERVRLGAG